MMGKIILNKRYESFVVSYTSYDIVGAKTTRGNVRRNLRFQVKMVGLRFILFLEFHPIFCEIVITLRGLQALI